ncbi:VenA family class IV lanthipeptide [Streptomyces sp. NPDC015220]|uniref:VenA family class IV lanthipeptide n=1 Tax=Streptomyces sp. NPDC015220 TaxID=3364947 RepID=UPI0036F859CD
MENKEVELLTQLHGLHETDPVEVEGVSYGGGGGTCACVGLLTALNTICIGVTCF